jgi:predicted signal transduction protein with EAL and GGDEF domain
MERTAAASTVKASAPDPVVVEQVRLLHASLPLTQSVALVNGGLLAFIQSTVIELAVVVAWLACLVLVTLLRLAFGLQFRRDPAVQENILYWRDVFLAGAVASALAWGAAVWVLYPEGQLAHQVFVAFTLSGMVAGSTAVLAPVLRVFMLYAVVIAVPVIARFIAAGTDIHMVMAAMVTVFLLAMLSIGKRIHETIELTLRLRVDNRALVDSLRRDKVTIETINADLVAAQAELRRTNASLETRVAQRTAALQQADRHKNEFLAMLSHCWSA